LQNFRINNKNNIYLRKLFHDYIILEKDSLHDDIVFDHDKLLYFLVYLKSNNSWGCSIGIAAFSYMFRIKIKIFS